MAVPSARVDLVYPMAAATISQAFRSSQQTVIKLVICFTASRGKEEGRKQTSEQERQREKVRVKAGQLENGKRSIL